MLIILLATTLNLTPIQQAHMNGRCHQMCIDESISNIGSYIPKRKSCICNVFIPIEVVDAPKSKVKPSPSTYQNESDTRSNFDYENY